MKSTLIKDTTKSERIQLIKEWEETEGCESSGIDLMTYFKDYIARAAGLICLNFSGII